MNSPLSSRDIPFRSLIVGTAVALVVLAGAAAVNPDRAWANAFIVAYYVITLGLGGALFVALTTVCGAGWSAAFRRVPEALTGLLPIAAIALLAIVALRLPDYAWHPHGHVEAVATEHETTEGGATEGEATEGEATEGEATEGEATEGDSHAEQPDAHGEAASVHGDDPASADSHANAEHHGDAGTFWFKELWLTPRWLGGRAVLYVVLWILFARVLVYNSRRQDAGAASSNVFPSILFLFVFAITITLAGVDWIMALEPLWFSTMWGVYQFAGLTMGVLAAMIVGCVVLRRLGPLHGVFRDDHLHDLGKLLLGFSCFWMYIWFSQYMLIWYSNIPEETSYFMLRAQGAWGPVVVGSLVLNWAIPFFALLPRPCKRNESVMLRIAVLVLIGRWVDLYVMVLPPITGATPVFGLPEVAGIVAIAGVATLLFFRAFGAARPVPQNDPYMDESLHYHC